jgi:hypothetical protein
MGRSTAVGQAAVVRGHGGANDLLVLREHLRVGGPESSHELRRPLDIREQEGDGAGRQLGHR